MMMTRTDILGLLTDSLEEELSLDDLKNNQASILEAYSGLQSDDEEAELDLIIADIYPLLQDRIDEKVQEEKMNILKGHLALKEALIEELRTLIQEEENIGKAFEGFKVLQERWNEIGDVPRSEYSRIQTEYSRLRENFFYNINIYKELADHDKRVNLRKKKELVEKVKLLADEKSITEADKTVKQYIQAWDNIGGTFQKEWEMVREEFWTAARVVINRANEHYEGIREKQAENHQAKKALIQQVGDIAEKDREKTKDWNQATDKVLAIQKQWKSIGFSKENEAVWQEFRSACDAFFEKKQAFYDQIKGAQSERKAQKEAIITEAATMGDSTDWKGTADRIIALQKQWKDIGSAGHRDENRLWKEFRGHCDKFFDARNEFFKGRNNEEKENLAKKKELLERIQAYQSAGNKGTDLANLRAFSEEWRSIGHVPFKSKDGIIKAYQDALGKHYDTLKLEQQERQNMRIQGKIDSVGNDAHAIRKEKDYIRRQIDMLKSNLNQYENNMGFINTNDENNPLLKEVRRKMAKDEARMKEFKETLKQLTVKERSLGGE